MTTTAHLTPSRRALSRMASSRIAAWLTLSFLASAARSRLASALRRILVNSFVSMADSIAHYELQCYTDISVPKSTTAWAISPSGCATGRLTHSLALITPGKDMT